MTAQELIASSLRLCGAIAGEETPTATEYDDALAVMHDVLENWTIEGLTPNATLDQTFTITAGVQTYTIGPGATFDGYRPSRIRAVKISGQPIPLVDVQYNATYPVATITFPDGYSGPVVITSELEFVKPDDSTDDLLLPPGYLLALRFELAVVLAPEYGLEPRADISQMASNYKADLKRLNIKDQRATVDDALLPRRWFGVL